MSAGTQLQPLAQPCLYFSTSVAMVRESPTPTTSLPPGSSITPRWQGSPQEAWWWGGPVLLHCGMQWGWQQCVGGRGPAGRVWAGCYTVCRLPMSWGRYGAGTAGEFFSGSPRIGCPLLSPTERHSTLPWGPHLMDSPPAALGMFQEEVKSALFALINKLSTAGDVMALQSKQDSCRLCNNNVETMVWNTLAERAVKCETEQAKKKNRRQLRKTLWTNLSRAHKQRSLQWSPKS